MGLVGSMGMSDNMMLKATEGKGFSEQGPLTQASRNRKGFIGVMTPSLVPGQKAVRRVCRGAMGRR